MSAVEPIQEFFSIGEDEVHVVSTGGLVDANEHAFFYLEVALRGDLDGGGNALEDDLLFDLPFLVELVHKFDDRAAHVLGLFLLLDFLFLGRHVWPSTNGRR